MGIVGGARGPGHDQSFFADCDGPEGAIRVSAVVIRRAPALVRTSFWHTVRRWLAPNARRPAPRPASAWSLPPGWDGATDGGGPREVLHSRAHGRVRVAGQEFALAPEGRTLVLLIDDERGGSAASPVVAARQVTIAPLPPPVRSDGRDEAEYLRRSREQQERVVRAIEAALQRDAVIRHFLETGSIRAG